MAPKPWSPRFSSAKDKTYVQIARTLFLMSNRLPLTVRSERFLFQKRWVFRGWSVEKTTQNFCLGCLNPWNFLVIFFKNYFDFWFCLIPWYLWHSKALKEGKAEVLVATDIAATRHGTFVCLTQVFGYRFLMGFSIGISRVSYGFF